MFTVQLSDLDPANPGTDTQTITIAVNGTNDAPVLTVVPGDNAVTEAGATVTGDADASGSFTVADDDAEHDTLNDEWSVVEINSSAVADPVPTAAGSAPANVTADGTYGTLTLNNDGTWSYALDNTAGGAADMLDDGEPATDSFTVRVADDEGGYDEEVVTITITGSNDGPVAVADVASGSVDEDGGPVTLDVLANDTDVDGDDDPSNFSLDSVDGNTVSGLTVSSVASGSFNIVSGELQFTPGAEFEELAVGESATVTATYTMSDDSGETSSATATFTVSGSNDDAVFGTEDTAAAVTETTGTPVSGAAALSDSGTLEFTDVDLTDVHSVTGVAFQPTGSTNGAAVGGLTASVTMAATGGNTGVVSWEYTIDPTLVEYLGENETLTEVFDITFTDNEGFTTTKSITATVTGTNDTPEIQAVDVSGMITEGSSLTDSGSITFTDVDLTDRPGATELLKSISATESDGITALVLTPTQAQAIEDAFSINDSGNTNNGTVTWDYTIGETELDFLGQGETVTAVFTVTVTDDEGATDTQDITITINGSNDAP